jgi:beta-glucosidase
MPNADGPAGIRIQKHYVIDGVDYYQFCTAFPVGTCIAMTWDVDAINQFGKAIGSEMTEYGVTSWLAPGMNIHRNPLCGRNFEYYSEDPLVTGLTAAYVTAGVQSYPGIGVTLKHFWGNSQEANRKNVNDVISERASREIYLKGFEIAVRLAKPFGIMNSYNEVNGWSTPDSYDTNIDILRGEWGYTGFVMTDWSSTSATEFICMHAGDDLIMPGGFPELITQGLVAAPVFNDDGTIGSAGSFVPNADGTVNFSVPVTARAQSELPEEVQEAIRAGKPISG